MRKILLAMTLVLGSSLAQAKECSADEKAAAAAKEAAYIEACAQSLQAELVSSVPAVYVNECSPSTEVVSQAQVDSLRSNMEFLFRVCRQSNARCESVLANQLFLERKKACQEALK